MTATIQKILKPNKYRAVDTSGNNNHGQIYSGRALEFDGVSDSLLVHADEADALFGSYLKTFACWINIDAIGSEQIIAGAWLSRRSIGIDSSGYLATCSTNGDDDIKATTKLEANTWYRIVVVSNIDQTDDSAVDAADANNRSHYDFYINGVLQEKDDANLFKTSLYTTLGARYNSGVYEVHFQGKLSDAQGWSEKWTASDALYDYLNPESLALSNGGTSLTESNLKLWYPMQDGHRGQKSYIMDGANTGLGSEEIVTGWNNNDFTSLSSTGTNITSAVSNGSANHELYSNAINMTSGDAFKVTFTLGGTTGSALRFYLSTNAHLGSADYVTDTLSTGTYTFYINSNTTDSTMYFGFRSTYKVCDFSVSNFSVKRVNYKHHATTVFEGDEMIATQANRQFTSSGQWAGYNSPTSAAIVGTKFQIVTTGDGATTEGATLPVANLTAPVAGRTYRIRAKLVNVDSANLDATYKFSFGGTAETITASDGTPNNGTITASEEEYYADVIAANSTGDLIILIPSAANDEATTFKIDDVFVKEIGVASGWTDADQQLDIPQTALQSYNQLAWFDGTGDYVDINPSGTIWNTTDGTFNSISCCVHHASESAGTNSQVMYFGTQNGSPNFYILQKDSDEYHVGYNTGNGEVFGVDLEKDFIHDKWHHWVMNVKMNSNSNDTAISSSDVELFLNGEKLSLSYVQGSSSNGMDIPADGDINLFGSATGTSYNPTGSITEVAVFNDQLTTAEVQELYNDGKILDAREHSLFATKCSGYWKNNGLSEWTDYSGNDNHGTVKNATETILLPAGVDASRDTQGFIMNRQKTTNSFNNNAIIDVDVDHSSYNKVETHPLYTGSAVTNYSISFWMKTHIKPSDFLTSGNSFLIFDTTISTSLRAFKVNLNHNNTLYLYTYYGTSSNDYVYSDYDLDNLGNSIQSPPTTPSAGIGEAFDKNKWYHVTFTFDHDRTTGSVGSNSANTNTESHNFTPVKLYINGIQITSEGREGSNSAMTTARSMHDVNVPLIIGSDVGADGHPTNSNFRDFPGELDDVCFYSDTLTDEEVLRNYKAGKRSHK